MTSEARHGALIGKIGEKGEIKAQAPGSLFLEVNDRDVKNNSGHYVVKVSIR